MSTSKSRINISVSDDVKNTLTSLAKRDRMPTATKAMRLLEIGLETEEDEVWDKIAAQRDKKGASFHTHAQVFGAIDVSNSLQ